MVAYLPSQVFCQGRSLAVVPGGSGGPGRDVKMVLFDLRMYPLGGIIFSP